jgi:sialate O-acetylesterase
MKKIALAIISTILLIGYVLPLSAAVRLPAIISSHMVVQQNSKVNFWGWSEPGEKITIKAGWDTATYTTTATGNAKWNIIISTPKAGGLFEISIKGENEIELEDVLIGEVWLCSGQSNMEMNVNWGLPYQEDVSQATNNSIRFFNVAKTTAEYPQEDLKGEWVVCSPATMKNFSAVGYFFGKRSRKKQHFR